MSENFWNHVISECILALYREIQDDEPEVYLCRQHIWPYAYYIAKCII